MDISRSSYYRKKSDKKNLKKKKKDKQNGKLVKLMKRIKNEKPFFGYRRMWAWLWRREGFYMNKKRVYRLMKENKLLCQVKRYKAKRISKKSKPRPSHKNQWWGIDMTKFLVGKLGWVYLVVVIDWYTKKLIGYRVSTRCRSGEWKSALQKAVNTACPIGSREYEINLMADNGCQPTSVAFINECATLEINQAFTSYDNPKGNADTERVIRTLKEECIWTNEWDTLEEAQKGIALGIREYNQDHLHSSLNYLSPDEFEKELENATLSAA